MVCTEVGDAQEPAVSTICAREIDPTTCPTHATERDAHVTVMTLRRLSATPVRRLGGYLITTWYVPRCVMLRSRPYRRFVRERSIQPLLRPRAHTSGMRASNGYDVTKVECNRTPVRRSGGYLITAWYVPRCVMHRSRPYRRFVRERSIQPPPTTHHTIGMRM